MTGETKWAWIRRATACAAALALAGAAAATTLEDVRLRGKLIMLCFPHQTNRFVRPDLDALRELGVPLTELHDPQYFSGIDVEIMKGLAERLGVDLEVRSVTTSYADLIPALLDGEGDVIASSITITEERAKQVDFSVPYLSSWVVVAARAGSKIRSLDDLKGKKGALVRGSSQLEYFRRLGLKGVDVELTDYTLESYLAVTEGGADFTLVDSEAPVGRGFSKEFDDLVVAFRLRPFSYGVAVTPGSDLLEPLNRYLTEMRDSGAIADIVARFPGTEPKKDKQ